MRIPSGTTDQVIYFVAVDATDFTTRETGLTTFTVYRARNGAAATAMTTPTVTEVDGTNMPGVYSLLLDEDMTIGSGNDSEEMVFHITHAGMAPVTRTIELYRPKITVGETLTVSSGVGSANMAQISGDSIAADNLEAALDGTGGVTFEANITGDITGNLSGAVGSVTGAVGSVTGNVGGTVNGLTATAQGNVRTAVGLASANLDTQLAALPTAAENATAVWAAGTRTLTTLDEDSTTLDIDAAVRAAVGLASANLDAQLTTIGGNVNAILADTGTDGVVVAAGSKTGYSLSADQSTVTIGTVNALGIQAKADVNAECDTALSDYDAPTKAELDSGLAGLNDISVSDVLNTQMTESYAADGTSPTLAQALFMIHQMLTEFSIASTTLTVKKLDGTTTAATFTLDDDTSPTSITRSG